MPIGRWEFWFIGSLVLSTALVVFASVLRSTFASAGSSIYIGYWILQASTLWAVAVVLPGDSESFGLARAIILAIVAVVAAMISSVAAFGFYI